MCEPIIIGKIASNASTDSNRWSIMKFNRSPITTFWNDVTFIYNVLICTQKYYLQFGLLSKLLASLMRNYFPKCLYGVPLQNLSKFYDVPLTPLVQVPWFICDHCRVAATQHRVICLVLPCTCTTLQNTWEHLPLI